MGSVVATWLPRLRLAWRERGRTRQKLLLRLAVVVPPKPASPSRRS
jgi:hypothetical protein